MTKNTYIFSKLENSKWIEQEPIIAKNRKETKKSIENTISTKQFKCGGIWKIRKLE